MREISNLELKIQLTNEYLRTGGVEKIFDDELLQDLQNVRFDLHGKAIEQTITPRLNAFMLAILGSHTLPPLETENHISEYDSFVQKSSFFDQHKIDTKKEVDELIEKYKDSKSILFRGQREAKWRLYSSLQRFWVWDKMGKSNEEYSAFLKNIIAGGRKEFETEISKILKEIHIDSLNDISTLGFLQHHDCPTPLLDWTYNFKTALFFGVDGLQRNDSPKEIDKYFSIYFIDEKHFESAGMRTLLSDSLQKISEDLKNELISQIAKNEKQRIEMTNRFKERSFFDKDKLTGSGLINHMTKIEHMVNIPISYFSDRDIDSGIAFSLTNSENIKKQDGVFTWNAHFSKPLEVMGNEQYSEAKLESEPVDYRFSECFNVNKDLSDYIMQKLADEGISTETMYPDNHINAKHIYDHNKNIKS
ncbi:FRG domain-containing protein [Adhaeribacter sp. BT258]|uniref:FRG domain-containing protein n=1 Tax=Adhaeribacter terrigena TaxID=2793070 RepID=A0ABS1C5Y9_9BACT|nr:FRG domain-containing protein [Adhaeribacter terrigena]MBK0404088.1 FRG domain-containing protein [Adhaeribacter terrigena]